MDETLTELEIARGTKRCFFLPDKHGSTYTISDRALHDKWHSFWCNRVRELEAPEKETQASDEQKDDLVLDRLAELERHFRSHTHDVPAVTGTTVTRGPTMHP